MAATCEERGIKHVKDVFMGNVSKSNSMMFPARKPTMPSPPSKTSAGQPTTLNGKARSNDVSKTNGFHERPAQSPTKVAVKVDVNNHSGPGAYFLRADKDKNINTMELPVPVAPPRKTRPTKTADSEDIYLTPSPVTSPTSPGFSKLFPAPPTSPGYNKNITETSTSKPTSAGYNSRMNGSPTTKYPAPPIPGRQPPANAPTSPVYSKAVANFQSPKSPSYSKEVNGFSPPPRSPEYSKVLQNGHDSTYVHHVEVHKSASFARKSQNISPTYDSQFDFGTAPTSPDNDVGSLFSGYDTQDSPYNTSPLNSPSHLQTMLDKTNNNTALFKKNGKQDTNNRFGNKKRLSVDETNSSLAPSSGYHSEFDSELGETSPTVDRSKGHQNLNSSFEEEECTFDFADDDEMYTGGGGHKYALYQAYEGEDFAKYMDDDGDTSAQPNTTSLARKVQRRRQYLDKAPRPPKHYTSNPRNKPGLKQRISQALTLTKTDKSKYVYQPQALTKIHQFSFMDSKMGHYQDEQEIQDYMSRDLETRSDIGGVKKRDSVVPSWHNDTLSMSTLRKAKRLLDQQDQYSSSVPNLHNAKDKSAFRSNPNLAHKGESYSDFGADIKRKKKVNRFKFWKIFATKKDKKKENGEAASSLGFDEPTVILDNDRIMDVHL